MNCGDLLKTKRKESNKTQEELAELIGVSTNTVQNWENENKLPSDDYLYDLYKCLNFSVAEQKQYINSYYDKYMYKEVKKDNFPYFIFSNNKKIIDLAKKACFLRKEIDLILYYIEICLFKNKEQDYSFYEAIGGYSVAKENIEKLLKKINYIDKKRSGLYEILKEFAKKHPNEDYSFVALEKNEILNGIKYLTNEEFNTTDLYKLCIMEQENKNDFLTYALLNRENLNISENILRKIILDVSTNNSNLKIDKKFVNTLINWYEN